MLFTEISNQVIWNSRTGNILLGSSINYDVVKLGDFGLSIRDKSKLMKNVKQRCGTLSYMAPELIRESNG